MLFFGGKGGSIEGEGGSFMLFLRGGVSFFSFFRATSFHDLGMVIQEETGGWGKNG